MRTYDSYKNSGIEWIGEIPRHWECKRLGMIGLFSSSGIDKKIVENEPLVKMVNYTDIIKSRKHNPIISDNTEFMIVSSPEGKIHEHTLQRGDLVFIPSSETDEDLGLSSIIDVDNVVFSYHIIRFQFLSDINHGYKRYFTNHHSVLKQFSSEGKGTTRQIIGRNVFRNIYVTLPPLSEQEQIVSYLDEKTSLIDEMVEKKKRKIELLKEYRTSLINTVVTKGLNPDVPMKDSGIEWIGEIPRHWKISKVYRHLFMKRGRVISKEEIDSLQGQYPVYSSQTENYGILGYINSYDFDGEYVTWTTDGANAGTCFIRKGKFNTTNVCGLLSPKQNLINLPFLNFLLNIGTKGYVRLDINPKLMNNMMGDIPLLLPPLSEQEQIVSYLDEKTSEIDKTIELENKKIELLKEYRQSLISNVVTGKIKVVSE